MLNSIPSIVCLRCKTVAKTKPQAIVPDGDGWKAVNISRPNGWIQGPAPVGEVTSGLCPACGSEFKANVDAFLDSMPKPPVEPPKISLPPVKSITSITPIHEAKVSAAAKTPVAAAPRSAAEKSEIRVPQSPPLPIVPALKASPSTITHHAVVGNLAASSSAPLKASIAEILSRTALAIPVLSAEVGIQPAPVEAAPVIGTRHAPPSALPTTRTSPTAQVITASSKNAPTTTPPASAIVTRMATLEQKPIASTLVPTPVKEKMVVTKGRVMG